MEKIFEIKGDFKNKTFEEAKDEIELKIEEFFAKKEISESMDDKELKKTLSETKKKAIEPLKAQFIMRELEAAADIVIKKYGIDIISCSFMTKKGIGNIASYSEQVEKLSGNLRNAISCKLLNDVLEDIE